jgi:hypothetical protein
VQQVQTIIHDRESADGDRKDLREFLDAIFNPLFAVGSPICQQEGASGATRL